MTHDIIRGMDRYTADEGKGFIGKGEVGTVVSGELWLCKNASINDYLELPLGTEIGELMKYSARAILRELRAIGKYEAFRQLLTSIGYDWEFLSANYLAEDDEDFKRLKTAVVEAGIVGSMDELDAMLAKCIWTAE